MSIDPFFLRGFRSLPDELKLMVLKHAVRTDIAIVSYLFLDDDFLLDVPEWRDVKDLLRNTVFPLLSIPKLKGFVKEVFYGENLMLIARQGNRPRVEEKGVIRYPPPSVAPLVRHIRWLTVNSKDISLNLQKLVLVSRLADGTLGFKDLKSVSINNNKIPDGDRDAFRKQLQALGKIKFPTRLLRIESVIYLDDDATVDDLELPLLETIDLQGDGPREECWQRLAVSNDFFLRKYLRSCIRLSSTREDVLLSLLHNDGPLIQSACRSGQNILLRYFFVYPLRGGHA
jgi:hypothetical protein